MIFSAAITPLSVLYFGIPLWGWICAGVALIALLILIIVVSGSSRKRSNWDRSFDIRKADARWFADSLTLAVADRTKGDAELMRTWSDGVPRMATLSQQLYELSTLAPSNARALRPREVSTAVDSLRQALDADVRLRTSGFGPGQDTMIAESAMIVSQRRRNLDLVLAAQRA